MAKVIKGSFSPVAGSKVRRVMDANGNMIGTITKLEDGGYRIFRFKDSKVKHKKRLEDAFKACARAN